MLLFLHKSPLLLPHTYLQGIPPASQLTGWSIQMLHKRRASGMKVEMMAAKANYALD